MFFQSNFLDWIWLCETFSRCAIIQDMKLIETIAGLLLPEGHGVMSITGAGGKTSTMTALARHFRSRGHSVLITTTTKIQSPKLHDYDVDHVFTSEQDVLSHSPLAGESVLYAESALMDPKKLVSPRLEILDILIPRYDVVLIEADGSKGLPLKYHTSRDPVVVAQTDATLAVIGASAFSDRVDNTCFGFESDGMVDIPFLDFLIGDEEGVLKRARGRSAILVNQADERLLPIHELHSPVPVLLGSVREDRIYDSVRI